MVRAGLWVTIIMVLPREWMSRSSSMTMWEERLSRLPVGSSARIMEGEATRERAMATRCCWPPESCQGM